MQVMESGIDKISLITNRDIKRKLDLQKRKDDKNNVAAANEKLGYFQETFIDKCTQIEDSLLQSSQTEKHLLPDHFNDVAKEILLLQKYVANSNLFLRTYDIKKCQEALQELTTKLKDLEDDLLPKKKFGFKNKPKPKVNEAKVQDTDEVDFQSKVPIVTKEAYGFTNKIGEILQIGGNEIFRKDVRMENLEKCTVKVFGGPSTLHLNHLKDCYVFTGPVSTSIFAENCTDCTLVIACQQLRLHASKNTNIYLHVTSRAIMEDCRNIFLAPYNLIYDGIDGHFKESGLDRDCNNWKSVDDFNWLNVEKHSPNWSLLDEEKIVNNWDNLM